MYIASRYDTTRLIRIPGEDIITGPPTPFIPDRGYVSDRSWWTLRDRRRLHRGSGKIDPVPAEQLGRAFLEFPGILWENLREFRKFQILTRIRGKAQPDGCPTIQLIDTPRAPQQVEAGTGATSICL